MSCVTPHVKFQVATTLHDPKKGIFSYNPAYGITNMRKHVLNEHKVSLVRYKEQRKVTDESGVSWQKGKKRGQCLPHPLHFFNSNHI